jgi:hypothetical protein
MVPVMRELATNPLKEALRALLAPRWQGLQEVDGIMAPLSPQQELVGGLLLVLDDCRAATEVLMALLEQNRRVYALKFRGEWNHGAYHQADSICDNLCANFEMLHIGASCLDDGMLVMIMEELLLPSGVPKRLLDYFAKNISDKTQILAMCRAIRKVDISRIEVRLYHRSYHSGAILLLGNKTILECIGYDESLENIRFLVAIYSQDDQTLVSAESAFQNASRLAVDAGAVDAMLHKVRLADTERNEEKLNKILRVLVKISADGCRDEVVESLNSIVADTRLTERTRSDVQKSLKKISGTVSTIFGDSDIDDNDYDW